MIPATSCSVRLGLGLLLLEAHFASLVSGAYFYVPEGEEKCFIETLAEHQVLTAKFKNIDNPGVPCSVLFKDSRKATVFSKMVDATERSGKVAYMTQTKGEHRICVACQGSKWFSKQPVKWELSVDVGDTDFTSNPATKGELNEISRLATAVLARIDAISAENEYERSTENEFRDISQTVNSRVVLFSVLIVIVEAALALWQITHLKAYFSAEKLIG